MKKILFAVVSLIAYNCTYSQCSDAGVCSIGGHQLEHVQNNISVSYSFGYSGKTDDVRYHSFNLSSQVFVEKNSFLNFELPLNSQSGPLGGTTGIGDLIVLYNFQAMENDNLSVLISGGLKVATSSINKKNVLPQKYQSDLGTNDILLGATISVSNFNFSLAYQLSGSRNTRTITMLKRGDDLLIKGGYNFQFAEIDFQSGLLFIKRIGKSSVAQSVNQFIEVPDSDQNQLNLLLTSNLLLNGNTTLFGMFALPLIDRKVNVDGLTRKYSVEFGATYKF